MAGFASSDVSVTQCAEFFVRFARFGGNMAKLQKLLDDDEHMERWMRGLDEHVESALIHGVYNTTAAVLTSFKARCAAKNIDFGKFSWIGSDLALDFDPNDPGKYPIFRTLFLNPVDKY